MADKLCICFLVVPRVVMEASTNPTILESTIEIRIAISLPNIIMFRYTAMR